ncbi:uncharacterized protein LOC144884811 [Branchiostoma floridae x Branchiostoma japonicum]
MATPPTLRENMRHVEWDIMGKTTTLLTLDLSDQHLKQLPDELFELTKLQALTLNENKNIQLSEKLIRLTNLKLLTLNDCNLETVPAAVMKLTQLEALILSYNRNITLPDEMSSLVNLTVLNLYNCNLDSLPPVVLKLPHLQILDLSHNNQISLHADFSGLEDLNVLRLRKCIMTTVPPAVLKLHQLEELDLSWNSGIHLTDELSGLTNIRVLKLWRTDMVTVPPVVWRLTKLEWLDLSSNSLQTLPAEVGQLTNVKHLKLSFCNLRTLPPEVGRLTQLKWLDLSFNSLLTLPAEVEHMTNIKHLDLSHCQLDTLPPEVWRLTQLEWLDLSYNPLQTLPAEVGQLTNVKHLALSDCQLHTLPPEVGRLTQLEWLRLSSNPLQTLPAEVGQLTNVKHLDLSHCWLRRLPPEVWRLAQLEWLDLSINPLQTLPGEVGQLTNVKHLDLSKCQLHTLPPEVGRLTQLEWLNLGSNPLQTLPAEVGQLTKVKHLDLSHCQLHTLPPEVWRLAHLEWLNLSSNQLQTLPAEVGHLANIKHLLLSECQLVTTPPEVGRLTQLEWLDLRSNPLQTLTGEVGQLTKLNVKHLDLSRCQLRTLPPEMGRLTQLEWLNLRSNPLQTLPAEVGQLTNVKHLDLTNCQLCTLPPEVGRLTQLKRLDLHENPLQTLAMEFGQFTNMKYLYLSDCELCTLPPELCRLIQLERLDLRGNPLQTLPAEVGQLTNVKSLILCKCRLYTLPSEVGRLAQLERLDLSFNQLQTLPAEVGQLNTLCHLDVSGNPLIKPPTGVCSEGITAIRQYFDALERSDQNVTARLKVVALGETMAGKTSLVQTLHSGESALTRYEDRTHCVEITQWTSDDNITFEVYDFGGHDVYHLTHQLFLTQGALNLVTVNLHTYNCTPQRYTETVGFWLDTLNARVPGAVVTIVGSKSDRLDDEERDEKTRDIRERFTQQQRTWQQSIQKQLIKLQNAKAAERETDQWEVLQQLERTRQLLTRPLRLTGVCCVSSAEPTSGLGTLRTHIVESANNAELFPMLRIILPQTWVKFEQGLRDLRGGGTQRGGIRELTGFDSLGHDQDDQSPKDMEQRLRKRVEWKRRVQGTKWLTREECLMVEDSLFSDENRLEPVLSYLQQVGTILRYTDIPELKELVFHDPSGLIEVTKELFHHDLMKVFTNKNPRLEGFSNTKLKKIRKKLSRKGFLPRDVVIALLGPHATPVGNVDVITNLMEHFGLCYAEQSGEQGGGTETPTGYFIPWYIQEKRAETINRDVAKEKGTEFNVTCEIIHFCPRGLFERLSVVVNKLITSRQDWKDTILAVRESLPIIVYRETKDGRVNIVVKLTVPAEVVKGTQVMWDIIGPLKDKLSALLLEWPGLLYCLVYSVFMQQGEQKGDQQTLTSSSVIPTFEVGPEGCLVHHGGVTLEFPKGCVNETRFISVEVETVPVYENIRTNFTAMSAVLTVEQDFPQRFLRPVTVRLPWVWTQPVAGKETTTVVLHYSRDQGWTVFQTDTHEKNGGVMFLTDHFQGYWVLEVLRSPGKAIFSWAQQIWDDYIKDKAYVIVTPIVTKRRLHLISMHKSDDLHDLFESPDLRFESQAKRRVTLKQDQWVKATFSQNEDVSTDPRDLRVGEAIDLLPPTTRSVRLQVKESVPMKDVYEGKVEFAIRGRADLTGTGGEQQFEVFVEMRQRHQVATTDILMQETEHPGLVEGQENTGLRERTSSHQHREARPKPSDPNPPRNRRHAPAFPIFVTMAMVAVLVAVVCQFYFADHITGLFGSSGEGDGFQYMSHTGKPIVLLVNDEYGTSKGGISTINRQLAKLLSSSGVRVFCTVLNATEEDVNDANADGVELIFPTSFKADKRQPTLDWLTWDHQIRYPNLPSDISYIIGHISITSRAASNIKEQRYPAAKLILFNHVIPEDTEHYKSESRELDIGEKSAAIRTDIEHADVVFSVGPNMYDYYRNQIRGLKPHYEFLPKPSDIFSRMNLTYVDTETKVVLSIGRVKGAERLKGYDLAAKAMGIVIGRFPKARWRVRGVSAEDFRESKKIIQANVENDKFLFTPLKYGTQVQLGTDMKEAHVVLMPSREEPFGLVGLEAIAAGVPVLVSSNSGLAEFLERKGPEFDRPIVDMDGSDDVVAERLAKRIIKVLKGGPAEFQAAKRLKDKLIASKFWEESHKKFLEKCGIPQLHDS